MSKIIEANVQSKRGTSAEWASTNPVLLDGEIGYDKTLNKIKVGNGTSTWSNLQFIGSESGQPVNVIDALNSTDPQAALSANQGRILESTKMSVDQPFKTINGQSILGTGNIVIQGGGSSVNVIDNLTSTSSTDALSAKQGKTLQDTKLAVALYTASKFYTQKHWTLTQTLDAIYDALFPSGFDGIVIGWSVTPPSIGEFVAVQTYTRSDLTGGKLNFRIPDEARCKCFSVVYPTDLTITKVVNTDSTEIATDALTGETQVTYQSKPAHFNTCDYQLVIQGNAFELTFANA